MEWLEGDWGSSGLGGSDFEVVPGDMLVATANGGGVGNGAGAATGRSWRAQGELLDSIAREACAASSQESAHGVPPMEAVRRGQWCDALLHLIAARITAAAAVDLPRKPDARQSVPTPRPPAAAATAAAARATSSALPAGSCQPLPLPVLLRLAGLFGRCCRLRAELARPRVLMFDLCRNWRHPDPVPLAQILAALADAWPTPLVLPVTEQAMRGRTAPPAAADREGSEDAGGGGAAADLVEAWAVQGERLAIVCRASPMLATIAWLAQRNVRATPGRHGAEGRGEEGVRATQSDGARKPSDGEDDAVGARLEACELLARMCGGGWAVAAAAGDFPPQLALQTLTLALLPGALLALGDASGSEAADRPERGLVSTAGGTAPATAAVGPDLALRCEACAALELLAAAAGPRWALTHVVEPLLARLAELPPALPTGPAISPASAQPWAIPPSAPTTEFARGRPAASAEMNAAIRGLLRRVVSPPAAAGEPAMVALRARLATVA